MTRLAVEAAPLGFTILLGSLQQNVPRFFLAHFGGDAALGVFAAASQLTASGDVVVGAAGAAVGPRLAVLRASGEARAFRRLTRKLVVSGAFLGVAGVVLSAVAGRWILELLYRREFGSGAPILVGLSAAAGIGFVASLLGYSLTAARVLTVQPALLAIALTTLVAGCAVLVPRYGGAGATMALIVASTVQAFLAWLALRKVRVDAPAFAASREAA
jgi:O-antigen/teichoic acid export membrane protein